MRGDFGEDGGLNLERDVLSWFRGKRIWRGIDGLVMLNFCGK